MSPLIPNRRCHHIYGHLAEAGYLSGNRPGAESIVTGTPAPVESPTQPATGASSANDDSSSQPAKKLE